MVVGVCRFVVAMPGNAGLKEKRNLLRPLLSGLRQEYHVSIGEVDLMDVPDRAAIGFALVGNDRRVINSAIDKIVARVETLAQVVLEEHDFEITSY
jgi:uncharacterized protein YlxP (DUF503 family)